MTDVAVSAIVEKQIELLITEAIFFKGVDGDMERQKKDLKLVLPYR